MKIKLTDLKTLKLAEANEFLHFWTANNAGRGTNNVTICYTDEPRAAVSANQNCFSAVQSCHWHGIMTLTHKQVSLLGLDYEAIKTAAKNQGVLI